MVISVSPARLYSTLVESEVWHSLALTVSMGLWTTFIGCLLGIPLAYLLARYSFAGKRLVEGVIDLPLVIPHTAAGIALLGIFGRNFFVGRFFSHFGLAFVGAEPGILIAMLFVSVPILVNATRDGFLSVDPRMEHVAQTLGASPWKVFWTISLPLARPNILSGLILMWARGISEFGAIFILVYRPMVAPVLVWDRFEAYGLDYAKPVAVLLLLIAVILLMLFRRLGRVGPGGRAR